MPFTINKLTPLVQYIALYCARLTLSLQWGSIQIVSSCASLSMAAYPLKYASLPPSLGVCIQRDTVRLAAVWWCGRWAKELV